MMTRLPVSSAPGPLEAFARHFDSLFTQRSQRQACRDYLAGLLLPAERNKTLTALAHPEPIVGAQAAPVQRLQWFLSECTVPSTQRPGDPTALAVGLLRLLPLLVGGESVQDATRSGGRCR